MFQKDLESGKAIEREFASRLMKWNVSKLEFSEGKFPEWDLKATFKKLGADVERTFEVKSDLVSDRTGNVGFEFSYKGEPSGVFTSKADCIVYKLGDEFYYVDRLKLLIWLATIEKQTVLGGDNNDSEMFLVKKDLFTGLAHKL